MKKLIIGLFVCAGWSAAAQNVGIGTSTPTGKLQLSGNSTISYPHLKLEETETDFSRIGFHNSTSSKYWHLAGLPADVDADSRFNIYNSGTGNLLTVRGNGNIGISNGHPDFPLNFSNALGGKVSFWNGTNVNYGIGLQAALLQMYTASSADDIAFGFGNSESLTENMRIKGNGNVGIGTEAPAYKLDLAGRMRIRNTNVTAGIYFDGTTLPNRSFVGTLNEDHMGFWGGGGASWNLVMNVNNGNVGIGKQAPQFPLDFANDAGGKISIWSNGTHNFGIGLQSSLMQIHTAGAGDDIAFGYGNSVALTENMRIKGNGNVGIGTSSPDFRLTVHGADNEVARFSSGTSSTYISLAESNISRGYIGSYSGADEDVDMGTTTNNATGKLHLTIQAVPKMTIDVPGNVGIGTTDPAFRLDVNGDVNQVARFNSSTNAMYVSLAEGGTALGYIGSYAGAAEDVDLGTSSTNTNGKLHLTTQASPKLTVDATGNVGIGNTSPVYKLDLSGRLRIRNAAGTAGVYFDGTTLPTRSFVGTLNEDHMGFWGGGGAGWNLVMNVNNGNTGIGASAPTAKLEVNGYTKLGSDAPAVKLKELSGVLDVAAGQPKEILTGLAHARIVSVNVFVEFTSAGGFPGYVPQRYSAAAGYEYDYHIVNGVVTIIPKSGNSANILNRNIKVMVTYTE